ncbi:MAG: 2-oxo-4-hydroxy-4-carboxy-5-ureidoimidazoline decarboxylase, partial [Janthinobacterium lividum]
MTDTLPMNAPDLTLDLLNHADGKRFSAALQGVYEDSPWIAERASAMQPFSSLSQLKLALQTVVSNATVDEQLGLIRAHPELAGRAALAGELTTHSAGEQAGAGLDQCSVDEYARLQQLNADYKSRFGFPFILAVRGPEGHGLSRAAIIDTFARRLANRPEDEMAESLRQIHRIAELRLNSLLGHVPRFGDQVMAWSHIIGKLSDETGNLTCAYLTPAHRATAAQLLAWMQHAGMTAHIDVLGNVVGRYASHHPDARTLVTGSHFDTVRNGGRFDGREGILVAIAVVADLHARGITLPYHLEVIAFAEEEGVRFKSTFLGSSAVAGCFDMAWLELADADGQSMRAVIHAANAQLRGSDAALEAGILALRRTPASLLGYVEVHIEQGPVLLQRGLPVGVVTSIAGSSRYLLSLRGTASHSGTTPMSMRRDAAAAAAEIVLYVEQRAAQAAGLVATVGQLNVPNGSINVIPGRCLLSLDVRAPDDDTRIEAVADILEQVETICARRQISHAVEEVMVASA